MHTEDFSRCAFATTSIPEEKITLTIPDTDNNFQNLKNKNMLQSNNKGNGNHHNQSAVFK